MGDDEGSKSVTQGARFAFSRPLLPKERRLRAFQIHEEVFAFNNDRWWEGVVTKVLDGSKCAVYIKLLCEEYVFRQSDLLLRYIKPQIQPEKKETVLRAFDINEEVFAFNKDRWWEGVITKVLEDSRCAVYIKALGQEFEFRQSDLLLRYIRHLIQPEKKKEDIKQHSMAEVDTASRKRKTSQKTTVWKATELQNRTRGNPRKVMITERDPPTIGSGHNACSRETANSAINFRTMHAIEKQLTMHAVEKQLTMHAVDNMGASPADELFHQPNEVDTGGGASVEGLGTEELFKATKALITSEGVKSLCNECTDAIAQQNEITHVVVDDQRNESKNEQNDLNLHHSKEVREENNQMVSTENHYNEARETANGAEIYRRVSEIYRRVSRDNMGALLADKLFYQTNEVDAGGGASVEGLGTEELFKATKTYLITLEEVKSLGNECTDGIEQQNEMAHAVVHDQRNESKNEQNDLTQHRCKEVAKENNQMVSTENHYNETREKNKIVLQSLVTDPTNNKVSVQHNDILPFVKSSVMWEEIESMEIFQQMPQQPHFRPLEQYTDIYREGMAIGHMITFANLVAKIGESQLNMPRGELEEMFKGLVDLETHGFNVGKLQARVEKLLEMKHKQEMLESRSKEVEEKINKLKSENDRFYVEFVEMEKSIRKHVESILTLKHEQESFQKTMEKNASDIIALQMEMDVVKDKFINAKHVKPHNQITTKNLLRNSLDRYLSQTRIFQK